VLEASSPLASDERAADLIYASAERNIAAGPSL